MAGKSILLVILCAFVLVTGAVASGSPPTTTHISSMEEAKYKLDSGYNFILVDVRSKKSYDGSHIDGAISIPFEELKDRYTEIPQYSKVIVYAACN